MRICHLAILLLPFFAQGQFMESFSDGDYSSPILWEGDTADFEVDASFRLHLNAPAISSEKYLSAPASIKDSCVWRFWVDFGFSPSASNFAKVYLQSNQQDLNGALDGYYVKLGGESGSNDAVEIYRQSGTSSTLVCRGSDKRAASASTLRVQVIRNNLGDWELWVDSTGGSSFVLEATGSDATYNVGSYLGVACKYTSTRSSLFWFDDFFADPLFVDLSPPNLSILMMQSPDSISVLFDEALDSSSASNPLNYQISPGIGNPISAVYNAFSPHIVELKLGTALISGTTYWLKAQNIQDLAGNPSPLDSLPIMYIAAEEDDVVINEFMADPNPPQSLPDAEFIELHNTSGNPFQLAGWTIHDASSFSTLGSFILMPDSFVILCEAADSVDFAIYGDVLVGPLPSLNNGGDSLKLYNQWGQLVNEVNYESAWYGSSVKSGGGWTLERIDPLSPCGNGAHNWLASEDTRGGTPGEINSLFGVSTDTLKPEITSIVVTGANSLEIFLSEALGSGLEVGDLEETKEGLGNPISISQVTDQRFALTFSASIDTGLLYHLSASGFEDCYGNLVDSTKIYPFGIFPIPDSGEIVINEILFNPISGGVDFLELYNKSNRNLSLSNLIIHEGLVGYPDSSVDSALIFLSNTFIEAGSYAVFTTSKSTLIRDHAPLFPERIYELDLPNFPDDEGKVWLERSSGQKLDELNYFSDWHYPLIDDQNGVSLERLSPAHKTQDSSNWHSGAETAGFASPTEENSMFRVLEGDGIDFFLEEDVFSPDGDGYKDKLIVHYALKGADAGLLNLQIFDRQGRLVRTLANNLLVEQEGFLVWDGLNDAGELARMGPYILSVELSQASGKLYQAKLRCVLAKRLR